MVRLHIESAAAIRTYVLVSGGKHIPTIAIDGTVDGEPTTHHAHLAAAPCIPGIRRQVGDSPAVLDIDGPRIAVAA